jgi:hypothetical protein
MHATTTLKQASQKNTTVTAVTPTEAPGISPGGPMTDRFVKTVGTDGLGLTITWDLEDRPEWDDDGLFEDGACFS